MRIAFALPGFHKYDRGAEIALIAVAEQLVQLGDSVTIIGSGKPRTSTNYSFQHAGSIGREYLRHFPNIPTLRSDYAYEDLTFAPGLFRRYTPANYDLTVTCNFPFTNLMLRRPTFFRTRPRHVFVTQNGDWPAYTRRSEFRFFHCDGLVCTNQEYYNRNRERWNSCLIPNGVDCGRFKPGFSDRRRFSIPEDRTVVLMVSALIPSKRVEEGIRAVANAKDAHLVVAGDGPLRKAVQAIAKEYLPNRFTLLSIPADHMPDLYRTADLFLHMSKQESFGNVFLEAMATGLPIVAENTAHMRWIVENPEYLIDTDNLDNVTSSINRAAKDKGSQTTFSVERARAFAWTAIGAKYQDFFRSLI